MTTTQQYYDYSSLSFAAYATDLLTKDIKTQYMDAGFAESQADEFIASGWEVVDQSSDALYGNSSPHRAY
jgi:hypothetical protein